MPPLLLSENELEAVLNLILKSGTAGLAWRKIRRTPLAATTVGRKLQEARLILAAEAAIRDSQIERLLAADGLGQANPILVKGWTHARLYPEPGLRPYGDFDLFVQPDGYEQALESYATISHLHPERVAPLDLQTVWIDLPERSWAELYGRSKLVRVRTSSVRILGPEDTLRLACLHLLRHFACNPLWLCDVAVMVEDLPADFDWDYCLSGQAIRTESMLAVIGLAKQVLGASIERFPRQYLYTSNPNWMVDTVLSIWGDGRYRHPWPVPRPIGPVVNRVSGPAAQILYQAVRALAWAPRRIGARSRQSQSDRTADPMGQNPAERTGIREAKP